MNDYYQESYSVLDFDIFDTTIFEETIKEKIDYKQIIENLNNKNQVDLLPEPFCRLPYLPMDSYTL